MLKALLASALLFPALTGTARYLESPLAGQDADEAKAKLTMASLASNKDLWLSLLDVSGGSLHQSK